MFEAAPSVNFFISILDNVYSILITTNSQINANENVSTVKRKVHVFYFSISFIWFLSVFLYPNEENCYKSNHLL